MTALSPVLVPLAVPPPVTSVPVVAGRVSTVPVPATALGCIVASPEVLPNIFTLPIVVAFTHKLSCDAQSVVIPVETLVSVVQAPKTTALAVREPPVAVTVPPAPAGVDQVPSHLR